MDTCTVATCIEIASSLDEAIGLELGQPHRGEDVGGTVLDQNELMCFTAPSAWMYHNVPGL